MKASAGINKSSVIHGALPVAAERFAGQLRNFPGSETHAVGVNQRMIVFLESISEYVKMSGRCRDEVVKLVTRWGKMQWRFEAKGRNRPPVCLVVAPFFDERGLLNKPAADATCPISNEIDDKKYACEVV